MKVCVYICILVYTVCMYVIYFYICTHSNADPFRICGVGLYIAKDSGECETQITFILHHFSGPHCWHVCFYKQVKITSMSICMQMLYYGIMYE